MLRNDSQGKSKLRKESLCVSGLYVYVYVCVCVNEVQVWMINQSQVWGMMGNEVWMGMVNMVNG